jgi:hypothetical protein
MRHLFHRSESISLESNRFLPFFSIRQLTLRSVVKSNYPIQELNPTPATCGNKKGERGRRVQEDTREEEGGQARRLCLQPCSKSKNWTKGSAMAPPRRGGEEDDGSAPAAALRAPAHVMARVFSQLDCVDLLSCSLVCKWVVAPCSHRLSLSLSRKRVVLDGMPPCLHDSESNSLCYFLYVVS